MKSMTAYGYGEFQNENYLMTMELKSYNNRFLEIGFFAPPYLSQYEAVATETIKAHAQRGHIDLSIKVKNIKSNVDVSVDTEAANAYMDAMISLSAIAREKGLDLKPSMGDILSQDGVLTSKVDSIANSLETVKKNVDTLEKMIRDNLTARIHEMLGDQKFDESRVLTEVAVMLNRYTINEEVVRLGAHIAEFRKLLQSNEPVGKRMDFLSQEMNREINTIGSKSQIVEVNFEVVNMKDSLENIREQIRNIE